MDLLDRLLAGGVVITGDITLRIADVDLVRIDLRALISSVNENVPSPWDESQNREDRRNREPKLDLDPDTVERDLVKLVLTVVELLRQLMERQALRRVDEGDLTEDQEERIGLTLMLLEDRMAELRERYGLTARGPESGPRAAGTAAAPRE